MKILSLIISIIITISANAENYVLEAKTDIIGAPTLRLILSEAYLITYTLSNIFPKARYSKEIIAFQDMAKKLDPSTYQDLISYGNQSPELTSTPDFYNKFSDFFNTLIKTTEYNIIKQQTIEYMKVSFAEWKLNLESSTQFIQKYSGFSFNYEAHAYITHPDIGNGRMHSRKNKILSFGAIPAFKNYFTVYIWHEIIHFHMEPNKINHAVNQLLTDNDLRVYLGGGPLFPLEGHPDLMNIMKNNLGAWEQYKKSPSNLNIFAQEISAKSEN